MRKMSKKWLAGILAAVMIMSLLPASVFAEEGHEHDGSCYTRTSELACGLEENEEHTHTDACYETCFTLNCGKEETYAAEEAEITAEFVDDNISQPENSDLQANETETANSVTLEGDIPAGNDAESVQALINTLKTVEELKALSDSELAEYDSEVLTPAEEAYAALSAEDRLLVTGADLLTASREYIDSINEIDLTKLAGDIAALPDTDAISGLSEDELAALKAAVAELLEKYDSLTEEQKTSVDAGSKLTALADALNVSGNQDGDADGEMTEAAKAVQDSIDALKTPEEMDEITSEDEKEAVYKQMTGVRAAYNALTDDEKTSIDDEALTALEDWFTDNTSQIPELLAGDNAKLKSFGFVPKEDAWAGHAISTGTGPWDSDDNPGNDSSANNGVVRTFDYITYTLAYETTLFDEAKARGISGYKEGTVYFEFILNEDPSEATFDTGSMGWLSGFQQATYEIVETVYGGKTCQVLRGSFLATPSSGNNTAIGSSYAELSVTVHVLNMKNNDEVKPEFTLWLKGNDVGTTYAGNYGGIPQSIVTGSGYKCPDHGAQEFMTVTGDPVKVSAAPRYNISVKGNTSSDSTNVTFFDFTEGKENPLVQNASDKLVYGRVYGVALNIIIEGKTGQGLRGIELPDENKAITFDLKLTNQYTTEAGKKYNNPEGYEPIFWSGERNTNNSVNADGRRSHTRYNYALAGPYGTYKDDSDYLHNYCYQGGNWIFEVDEADPSIIHVTVSGFNVDLTKLPYTYADGASYSKTYYNKETIGDSYWLIEHAYISSGECWYIQPYNNTGTNEYVGDELGVGTMKTTITDSNLVMTGISGTSPAQAITNDDTFTNTDQLYLEGTCNVKLFYSDSVNDRNNVPLSDGCLNNGQDWATTNQKVNIQTWLSTSRAEGMNQVVGRDLIIKYDNVFFEPSTTNYAAGDTGITVLWGGKSGGWNHQGLMPDQQGYDDDMISTPADSLVWFTSLSALKKDGYTPVAVMLQVRGRIPNDGGQNPFGITVKGRVKTDCPTGYTYLAVGEWHAWSKKNVCLLVAEHTGKAVEELENSDYRSYMREVFPSLVNVPKYADFPAMFYSKTPDEEMASSSEYPKGYQAIRKAVYVNGNYEGDVNNYSYADSCLVVPYVANISKYVAQQNDDSTTKKIYDMGQSQRVVDYVLDPSIKRTALASTTEGAEYTTTVTITDTLPAELTYISGSSYWDAYGTAEYTQAPRQKYQGTVTGARKVDPQVTLNDDGTTTLIWTLENVKIGNEQVHHFGNIWFSCTIGTQGDEENDVTNQQLINNVVTIQTTEDCIRKLSLANGNRAEAEIEVLKLAAIALAKTSDQDVIDAGEPIGYTITIGNNSSNIMNDVIIVDNLPFKGDAAGSEFDGELYLSELVPMTDDAELYSGMRYFYTTNEDYRTWSSTSFIGESYTLSSFISSSDWTELTLNADASGFTNLPSVSGQAGNEIVAIVICGSIPAQKTLKLHLSVELETPAAGDYLVNQLSNADMNSYARTSVVVRRLSGLTWLDANHNGIRENSETLYSGVKVTLLKLNEETNAYEVFKTGADTDAVIETGKQMNLLTGAVSDIEPGYSSSSYLFTYLPAGTFAVRFEDGTVSIKNYSASPVNAGDDTKDSDATGSYTGTVLNKTEITGIVMPVSKDIRKLSVYESRNNDSGYYNLTLTATKTWNDKGNQDGMRTPEVSIQLYADGVAKGEPVKVSAANRWTASWANLPGVDDGNVIVYTVKETEVPQGYTCPEATFENDKATVTNTHVPETIEITVTKLWADHEDRAEVRPSSITLDLMKGTTVVKTATVTGTEDTWSYTFEDLDKYENGVEIEYTVKERPVPGYTGDVSGFTVTNTYEPEPVKITLSGTKTFTGFPEGVTPPVFTYTLVENGITVDTKTTNGAGNYSFKEIVYDDVGEHSYTVTETKGTAGGVTYAENSYTVTVKVTDDGTGKLVAAITGINADGSGLDFTNSYTPEPVKITLSGTKTFNGFPEGATPPVFTFTLAENGDTVETKTINGAGEFTFKEISYTSAGKHTYTVTETKGTAGGVTYAENSYTVTVEVTDDGMGKLAAAITGINADGSGLDFTNSYKPEPVKISLSGTKTFTGFPEGATVPEFSFTLSENGTVIETKTITGAGAYSFKEISYSAAGVHTYTIAETKGSAPGVEYDTGTYTVTVTVTDDGTGKLSAEITGDSTTGTDLDFTNTYIDGSLSISKTVSGGDKTKLFIFTVTFDAPGSYAYSGSYEGMISSGDSIKLKDGESITISGLPAGVKYTVTESKSDGYKTTSSGATGEIPAGEVAEAKFINTWTGIPSTGDDSNTVLWAGLAIVSMFGIGAVLLRKRREEKE